MATSTRKSPSRAKKVTEAAAQAVVATVKDVTPKSITSKLGDVKNKVLTEVTSLETTLVELAQQREALQLAIELKQQELQALRGIEATADTQNQLHDQIETTRVTWKQEQEARDRAWADEQTEHERNCKQRNADFEFQFAKTKREREQALENQLAERQKVLTTQWEAQVKQLNDRQERINAAEQELKTLREMAATREAEIKRASDAAVAVATNALKREYEFKLGTAAKDLETTKTLTGQEVAAAKAEVARLQAQLEAERATNASLQDKIERISTSAFQAVSGQQALSAVQSTMAGNQASAPTTGSRR